MPMAIPYFNFSGYYDTCNFVFLLQIETVLGSISLHFSFHEIFDLY